ncbi:uncharacterized protein NECHADRAFT_106084 [Fusarium vanettenii 77-13-4]|uniref:chitinase n=1 Tax=Fusarium vanettenii (strain ATCC MYA-4622 / CBS 123669 / FGSC 9596 / NRRL 45880 / 77-13-4) TaxID=660122 RepID=C7Z8D1_FUSV7|nr:uncharacterized protein NECHADRAFT_106084 [Fusarium vanettenii 77-13-4]EEU39976.1 hypothetical protein NECHADRAFT_106084 [Fusarium vanettenii 77-13-4]
MAKDIRVLAILSSNAIRTTRARVMHAIPICSKDNYVAGCDAKAEYDPSGFRSSFANYTKCPLNVYYSKYSYYGTTKDFCGKKTMNRLSCSSKSSPIRRVFRPSNIPDSIYTHINFAFASINPKTFQIILISSNDPALYRELIRKKEINPNLKANQRTFIKSLILFIATYGFNEDEKRIITIFLTHFNLEKISKYIDYFNFIIYNFHVPLLTISSQIKDAFDLLWRNKIDPNQVNIGLAFYAYTFSISNPGCMSPGCLFDAGGSAEPYTNAVGVMSNPEIMGKLVRKSQGELDKTAASKILKFGHT